MTFTFAMRGRGALRTTLALACATVLGVVAASASAQSDYPNRPVRVIVPVPPGGVTDIAARNLAPRLSDALGQQFVVENRPGAAGSVGVEAARVSPPDGYTLLLTSGAEMTVNPAVFPKLTYSPLRDFVAIVPVSDTAIVIATHPSVAAGSLKDLIAMAKAKPNQIAYASAGNGTVNHMTGEWLWSLAQVDLLHVPYKGGGPATVDVVGGQVPVGALALSAALPHARAGKLKILGVSTAKRVSFAQEWPTIAEQGFPGFETSVWVGLFAPAGTAKEIVSRLNTEVNRIMRIPDIRERFIQQGGDPLGGSPEEFTARIRADQERYGKLVRQYNIRPD